MTAAGTFIPKVFEEHFGTVGLLWARRRVALRSPEYFAADVVDLDETIEAHLEGIAAAGEDSLAILEADLLGDDHLRAFAAGYALLAAGAPDAPPRVVDAFVAATGAKLDALRDALAYAPSADLVPQLTSLVHSAAPDVGAAAGEALALRGALSQTADQLARFIRAENPAARAAGWRTAAYCGVPFPEDLYVAAFKDEDPGARRAAFDACAWNRSWAFYQHARSIAASPTPETVEALATFAAVAPPEEYQLIAAVAANPAGGPDRFRVVASFGHPYFIELLLREMENPDPAVATPAGAAFERMTGWPSRSVLWKQAPADGEAVESAFVPDVESARRHWAGLAPRLAHAPRIAQGFDVSQNLTRDVFDALDMQSRWEYCLRMRLFSGWQGTPLVLERYPQRF